jgi:hypothetical protein
MNDLQVVGHRAFAEWRKFILGVNNDQCSHSMFLYARKVGQEQVAGNLILADRTVYAKSAPSSIFVMLQN